MEDQLTTAAAEPQQFENIDFNSSAEDNKESSNNDDHDQVLIRTVFFLSLSLFNFIYSIAVTCEVTKCRLPNLFRQFVHATKKTNNLYH